MPSIITPTEPISFVRSTSSADARGSMGSMMVTHFSRSGAWPVMSAIQLL